MNPFDHPPPLVPWDSEPGLPAQPGRVMRDPAGPLPPKRGPSINYLTLFWSRKYLILGLAVLGALAGILAVILRVPVYRSSSTLELLGVNESFMGLNTLDPQAGTGSYGATATNVQTQTRILMSATLKSRVVERMNLELAPTAPALNDVFARIRAQLHLVPVEPVEQLRNAVKTAAKTLVARGIGASRLLELTCDSTSPEVSAGFANTLANEFLNQNLELRTRNGVKTMEWMQGQIEETKSRLEQSDQKLQDFISKAGIAFAAENNTLADSKLRQLQADLAVMQTDRMTKQSRWELAKSSSPDLLPDSLDDGTIREYRSKINTLRAELAQLTTTLTPGHYKAQRVQAQIQENEASLQRERTALRNRVIGEYETAVRKEKLLSDAYQRQLRGVATQSDKATQYAMLRRDVEMTRQTYNSLMQQYNNASVAFAIPTNNVRVIDAAPVPIEPVSPKPVRDTLIGAFLGLAAGVGITYLQLRLKLLKHERIFLFPGDTIEALRIPELGVIPFLPDERSNGDKKLSRRLPWRRESKVDPPAAHNLVVQQNKASITAESFRLTMASILARLTGRKSMLLVVTSPGPGEGKTTVVSNLALATVETGRKVLLIDADVRRSRLHGVFGVEKTPGFAELLSGGDSLEEMDFSKYIRETQVRKLFLLPAGTSVGEFSGHLFHGQRLQDMLAALRREYDLILLDTAPATHFADAHALARFGDGVVLVVRSGQTGRQDATALMRRFAQDGAVVLGAILNDWTPDQTTYSYKYDNYYSQTK